MSERKKIAIIAGATLLLIAYTLLALYDMSDYLKYRLASSRVINLGSEGFSITTEDLAWHMRLSFFAAGGWVIIWVFAIVPVNKDLIELTTITLLVIALIMCLIWGVKIDDTAGCAAYGILITLPFSVVGGYIHWKKRSMA